MEVVSEKDTVARSVGRYVLFREVAHGGMATVHLGRLRGAGGFARTVAIKRLHPPFARDPEFVAMFFDEARLAARVQHPNVVSVLDVVASDRELFLVMEYVHGEGLSRLLKRARAAGIPVPPWLIASIVLDVLYGLHAAHEARNERGDPLHIVHRDVSPQNVLVGVDGVARVLDFGIAKAAQCVHAATLAGELKGKLGYMAPEQISTGHVDRRADVYATAVLLWEALTGQRMFPKLETGKLIAEILTRVHVPPSRLVPTLPAELDAIVMRGLQRDPQDRYPTARDMAIELESLKPAIPRREIGDWVARVAESALRARSASIAEVELTPFTSGSPVADVNADAETEAEAIDVHVEEDAPLEMEKGLVPTRGALRARLWLSAAAVIGLAILALFVARVRWSEAQAAPKALAAATVVTPRPEPSIPAPLPAPQPPPSLPVEEPPPKPMPSAVSIQAVPVWTRPPARNDCSPPYTVQAGVRIPKRYCP
jgi:serine/threonine-protein kinase